MGASNKVIAGDYNGSIVSKHLDILNLKQGFLTKISKETVESYEIVSEERNRSAGNVALRGLVGAALLGPVGLAAGALSSKKKGVHQIVIHFRDGKKSMIEVDDKIAKSISITLF